MMFATVDATGIHTPTYDQVLEELKGEYKNIYGEDVYLEADSQDGQFVAILALAIKDANDMAVMTYNTFSPTTAVGAGLSSIVKVNGIKRMIATYSTVDVTLTGIPGTQILNGAVVDNVVAAIWYLPPSVTLVGGTSIVTATAAIPGFIYLGPDTVNHIITPVIGWNSVTNVDATTPGDPVEIDAQLRRRQAVSTANPSETVRESIYSSVADVVGVQRLKVYENWEGLPDENGIPGHSISVIVEGGDITQVATAVAYRKPPGTGTYGDIRQDIIDAHGVPNTIWLFDLINTTVKVLVYLKPLSGFISSTTDLIKTSLVYWLTNQDIGNQSYYSRLIPPLELSGTAATETTGKTQEELDQLSKTYVGVSIAQATPAMHVVGNFPAGSITVIVFTRNNISKGDTCFLSLTAGGFWKVIVSDVVANIIGFEDYPIPAGQSVTDGALVYLSDDIAIDFRSATFSQLSDITIIIEG